MNGKRTRIGCAWKERIERENAIENDTETRAILLAVTETATWVDESLLKACASWQEKPTHCYGNSAARDAHIGDPRSVEARAQK